MVSAVLLFSIFFDMGIDLKVHERSFIWNSHFGY